MSTPIQGEGGSAVEIRAFETADRESVSRLRHAVWHRSYGSVLPPAMVQQRDLESFLEEAVDRPNATWLLCEGENLPGCYSLDANCIDELLVDPGAQRCGHGSALLNHARVELKERGFAHVQVGLEDFNSAGIAFFRQAGWQKIGSEALDFPGGLRVAAMTWSTRLTGPAVVGGS